MVIIFLTGWNILAAGEAVMDLRRIYILDLNVFTT